jgi:hypothetical protein
LPDRIADSVERSQDGHAATIPMKELARVLLTALTYGVLIVAPPIGLFIGPVAGLIASVAVLIVWLRIGPGFSLLDGTIATIGFSLALGVLLGALFRLIFN